MTDNKTIFQVIDFADESTFIPRLKELSSKLFQGELRYNILKKQIRYEEYFITDNLYFLHSSQSGSD